jgi:hypothetical protein
MSEGGKREGMDSKNLLKKNVSFPMIDEKIDQEE